MPDSVRYNIKYLVSNLDVSLILEDLLENDVLSEQEYDTASGKENEKLELAKYVVRLMLKKTEEQVDSFLKLVEHSQRDVAEHVASTMAKRRAAKPMSADRESTRGSPSDNPFDLTRFVCDIQPWLNKVDADLLRRMVIKKHLITDSASIERLKRIQSRDGLSDHNEALIQLLRAGGLTTYRDLCVVIEDLGYVDKSKEMLSILGHTDGVTPEHLFELERAKRDAARRGDTTSVRFLHIAILGAARCGKTSLLKTILGEEHDSGEKSTLGMKTSFAVTTIENGQFIVCSDVIEALRQLYVTTILKDEQSDSKRLQETDHSTPPHGDAARSQEVTFGGAAPILPGNPSRQILISEPSVGGEDFVQRAIEAIRSSDMVKYIKEAAAKPDFTVITFQDLAGQQIYQSVQPLLIMKNTAFIVAYNASKNLEAEIDEKELEEMQMAQSPILRATLPSDATHIDQVFSWLDMPLFHSKSDHTDETSGDVFMVGCHGDVYDEEKVKETLPDPKVLLHNRIKESRYKRLVSNQKSHFLVNNTKSKSGDDDGAKALKKAIADRCEDSRLNIPVTWLRFCMAIELLKTTIQLPWLDLKSVQGIAEDLDAIGRHDDEGMKELLKYGHESGHLAYFPTRELKHLVILDKQFVLDCVTALAYVDLEDSCDAMSPSEYDEERYGKGFISEALARFAFNQFAKKAEKTAHWKLLQDHQDEWDSAFHILQELSVLVITQRTVGNGQQKQEFIMPAVVPNEALEEARSADLSPPAYICLEMTGEEGHQIPFPVFLYWQCVVEMLKESPNRTDCSVSFNGVRLYWVKDGWQWLRLSYARFGLRVCLERSSEAQDCASTGQPALALLKSTVQNVLSEWSGKGKLQASVVKVLPCPTDCKHPSGVKCLEHGRKSCNNSCPHALHNVTVGLVPVCRLPRPPVTQMIRQAAKFWLGLEQDAHGRLFEPRSTSLPSVQDSSEASSPTPATDGASLCDFRWKTLAQIKDWVDFESVLQNFVAGEERRNLGRAAVILVDDAMRNVYGAELNRFHEANAGVIRGEGRGMDNLFCIILYLINKRQGMTINELYGMLAKHAESHRGDIWKALSEAAYND
ncbi:uncharacterized protein LOC135813640 [Sycon ciliatum]|uniref:uncharacterized protein LOC135813640 n=1 Tax=Sycon ciliatum TaxID=27933 RepID=UPI0031F64FF8